MALIAGAVGTAIAGVITYFAAGDFFEHYMIPLVEGTVGTAGVLGGIYIGSDTTSSLKPYAGLALGTAGSFLIYDAYQRYYDPARGWDETFAEAKYAGEMGLGGILALKGSFSLLNVSGEYSGTFKWVDLLVGLGGVGGGGYLIWHGYSNIGGHREITSETKDITVKNYATGGSFKVAQVTYFSDYKTAANNEKKLYGSDGERYDWRSVLTDTEAKTYCKNDGNVWLDPPQGKGGLLRGCYAGKDKDIVKEYNRQAQNLGKLKGDDNITELDRKQLFDLGDNKTCQQWVDMFGYNGEDGLRLSFVLPNECRDAVAQGKDLNFVPKAPLFY